MQLDKTRIAIRERSFPDILDLSLQVMRRHALALAATFLATALPLAIFNYWCLGSYINEFDADEVPSADYFYMLLALLIWELPLAAAPTTLYLGQVLFTEQPSVSRLCKDLLASLPQLILFQIVLRGMLCLIFLTWPILFWVWPYLNEIILLERNPWRKRGPYGASTASRSSNMHARNRGELFSRWLGSLVIGAGLISTLLAAAWFARMVFTYQAEFDRAMYTLYLQLAIWIVIGYFVVVRFLSYLDLRIRTEGWEVELIMRAEAARLTRQLA